MTQKSIWKFYEDHDLNGYTLIIPSVAVGNVGQLACDLLISSLDMQKIASMYSPALIPVLGYDPYDLNSDNLSSCCEVYKCVSRNVAVLQLRAPLVYKYAREFLENLVKTYKEKQIKDIIILSSSFAHEKKHILTSPFRYMTNDICSHKNGIVALNWMEHESPDGTLKIYGGGFATLLFEISSENGMPCLILYKYCSEGDNIPDAYDMINYLTDIVPLFKDKSDLLSQLVQPVSWKLLFGRPPPRDIY
ncbi:proteasome assembly chaperone 2 [Pectinophora gossypiella]|uniref:proteasome assembly chaperone 2 n=1 Tax=Pectinophora gossypiella TaxID=13191 RepID=UPI00214E1C99|nr:proteasome assembly chaperone 2 [Pectinophora gossypiella]